MSPHCNQTEVIYQLGLVKIAVKKQMQAQIHKLDQVTDMYYCGIYYDLRNGLCISTPDDHSISQRDGVLGKRHGDQRNQPRNGL